MCNDSITCKSTNPTITDQLAALFGQECSRIFEHVYVCGAEVAGNREDLDQRNIRYIINCAANVCPNVFETDPDFHYLTIRMADGAGEDISWFFPQVCIRTIKAIACSVRRGYGAFHVGIVIWIHRLYPSSRLQCSKTKTS